MWINPWSFSLCSAWEAQQSRRFGNQTPIPDAAPVLLVDPREPELCPRPSVPSSPLPATLASSPLVPVHPAASEGANPAVSPVQLPVSTPGPPASSTLPNPPIRLRSQVAPSSFFRTCEDVCRLAEDSSSVHRKHRKSIRARSTAKRCSPHAWFPFLCCPSSKPRAVHAHFHTIKRKYRCFQRLS